MLSRRRAVVLTLVCGLSSSVMGEEGEAVELFDGESLAGWSGDPRFWSVEDGAITGQTTAEVPTDGNTFLVWEGGEPGDFVLTFEYRVPSGNSGMQYRSFRVEGADNEWRVGGYQADFEAGDTWSGICYGERFGGILAKRGERVVLKEGAGPELVEKFGDAGELGGKIKKGDEWNDVKIVAEGNRLRQYFNGELMCDLTDERGEARAAGILALQLHAGPPMKVQMRNVKLVEKK